VKDAELAGMKRNTVSGSSSDFEVVTAFLETEPLNAQAGNAEGKTGL
jgi:hypothetical protein